jgi:hypothetical protein
MTGKVDPFCTCIATSTDVPNDICINDFFGDSPQLVKTLKEKFSREFNKDIEPQCPCFNTKCNPAFKNLPDDTFIPLYLEQQLKSCEGVKSLTICNTEVKAGGNISGPVNIEQKCQSEIAKLTDDDKDLEYNTEADIPSPPGKTSISVNQPTPSPTTPPSSSEEKSFLDKFIDYYNDNKIIVISIIIFIIIFIIIIIYLLVKKNDNQIIQYPNYQQPINYQQPLNLQPSINNIPKLSPPLNLQPSINNIPKLSPSLNSQQSINNIPKLQSPIPINNIPKLLPPLNLQPPIKK